MLRSNRWFWISYQDSYKVDWKRVQTITTGWVSILDVTWMSERRILRRNRRSIFIRYDYGQKTITTELDLKEFVFTKHIYKPVPTQHITIQIAGIIMCELIARMGADPDVLPRTSNFGVDYIAFSAICLDCPADFIQLAFNCVRVSISLNHKFNLW